MTSEILARIVLADFYPKIIIFVQIQDVKDRMNHLKVMSCRQNMLHEIRNRRIDQEDKSGFM